MQHAACSQEIPIHYSFEFISNMAPGPPACLACERCLATELESPEVRLRWQWEEGLKWRWGRSARRATVFWPCDYQVKSNSCPGWLRAEADKRSLVGGDFDLTQCPPEFLRGPVPLARPRAIQPRFPLRRAFSPSMHLCADCRKALT